MGETAHGVGFGSTIEFREDKDCCCAVGMCENSRQRVIQISIAAALIFLSLQVACAVNGGYLEVDGGVAFWLQLLFRT